MERGGPRALTWLWIFLIVALLEVGFGLADLLGQLSGSRKALNLVSQFSLVSRAVLYAAFGMASLAGVYGALRAEFRRFPLIAIAAMAFCDLLLIGLENQIIPQATDPQVRHAARTLATVIDLACAAGVGMMIRRSIQDRARFAMDKRDVALLSVAFFAAVLLLLVSGVESPRFDPHEWLHAHASVALWPVVLLYMRGAVA
jgi:hypothetical protein